MKSKIISALCITLAVFGLTACGSSSSGYSDMGINSMKSSENYDGFYTGGDYSSTNINSSEADYSYDFAAGGESTKTKSEMLADYEYMQDFVMEKGGFIEDVYNDYTYYDTDQDTYYDNEIRYKSVGSLSYTIEIDNDNIQPVLDELEKICQDNKFTVTRFTQRIYNYQNYEVVDSYDDDDYYYGDVITRDELDHRLEYADISVRFDYRSPRSGIARFGMSLKTNWHEFWESMDDVIKVILVIFIVIFALFGELIVCYKLFKKMQYKHRLKKPEYYPPVKMEVVAAPESVSKDAK